MNETKQIFCGEPDVFTFGLGKIQAAIHRAIGRLSWMQQPPCPMYEMTPEQESDERYFMEYELNELVEDAQEIVNLLLGPDYIIIKKEEG